jgi:hypothetical protein
LSVLGNPEQEESCLLNITMQHSVNDILFLFYHSYFNRWFGDSMKVQYNH